MEVGPEEVGLAAVRLKDVRLVVGVGLVNVGLVVGPVGLVEAEELLPPVEGHLDASVKII